MILIAFGSSLSFCGKAPSDIITSALRALMKIGRVGAVSGLYKSPAWPNSADPPFVNAVARLETGLSPEALMAALHAIEAGFGRRRGQPNAPRTLDLDLIDYAGRVRAADSASGLVLPHPAARSRDFVLLPLAEIAPDWRHPATDEPVADLIARLPAKTARPLNGPA